MNKRKLMLVAIALCMAAILLAGGTLAYLTDTDQQTNTFTTGHVALELDEAVVEKDPETGDLVATGERTDNTDEGKKQNYHIYPGNVVTKDPTITVLEGSENSWVAAKVVIKGDLLSLFGNEDGTIDITRHGVISGGLFAETGAAWGEWKGLSGYGNGNYFIVQDEDSANNTWTLYVYMKGIKVAKDSFPLFTTMTIPDTWNNDEMAMLHGMSIDVTAYAVQADGFLNCAHAMATAFDAIFPATTDATAE